MFSNFSVKKPMTVFVCVVLVIMLGVISFTNMTTDLLPSLDLPYVVAYATYVGANPEQVEQDVTRPIEAALATTSGLKNMTSISQENVGIIILEFESDTSMDSVMIEMTSNLDALVSSLPENCTSPSLMKINPDMLPIMVLAVDRDGMDSVQLSRFTNETVIPALERVDGVASVSGSGLVENQVRIGMNQELIDDLNDRVLRTVDSKLADAEKKLKDARKEIDEGKEALEEQSGTGYEELVKAAQQLDDTKSQTSSMATITGLEVTALEATLNQYDNMVDLQERAEASDERVEAELGAAGYSQLNGYQVQRRNLQTEKSALEAELDAAYELISNTDGEHPDLVSELSTAETERDNAKANADEKEAVALAAYGSDPEVISATNAITSAKAVYDTARADYDAAVSANSPTQTTRYREMTEAEAAYESALEARRQILLEKDSEYADAYDRYNRAEADYRELNTLKNEYDEAKNTVQTAPGEIASLETQIVDKETQMRALSGGNGTKLAAINEWMAIQDEMLENGFTSKTELDATIDELKPRIPALRKELVTAKDSQTELDATLDSLSKAQISMESGKFELSSQIIQATIALNQADEALIQAEEEFETQRDEAYRQAGLDGIITQSMIAQLLTAENFSMPAGYLGGRDGRTTVKVGNAFGSVEELKDWVLFHIPTGDIGDIYLTDIATVEEKNNAEDLYAKINGNDGVLLTINKSSIASTSGACDNLYKAITSMESEYDGLHLTALSDQGEYIDLVVDSVIENLIYGGVLAIIVLLLFLKDFRPTLIVALSIPISLMFALVLMYFSGVSLNVISLSGLALGVGMLVDNSIVAIENIYRLRQLGYNAATAAVQGCKQIAGAIAASTLTTVCVFTPILFTKGLTRQLFSDMGLTIAYSLGASLLVALTLVPAVASKTLKTNKEIKPNRFLEKLINRYEIWLRTALRRKKPVLAGTFGLLALSIVLTFSMGTQFIPDMDSPEIAVTITMPEGATHQETREMCNLAVEKMMTVEGVKTIGAMEQESLMGGETLSIYVLLNDGKRESSQEIAKNIEEATRDLDCTISANGSSMDMTSFMSGSGVQIKITGDDMDTLKKASLEITERLEDMEGIQSVDNGLGDQTPETRIIVDKTKAMEYNLTVAQVFAQVAQALPTETKATSLTIEGNTLPVVVVPDDAGALTRENIKRLKITGTKDGEDVDVYLEKIAEIVDEQSPMAINRSNQSRIITVTASLEEGYNIGLVTKDVEENLKDYEVPGGCQVEVTGENEMIESTLVDLVKMILLAVAFIYLIMVAQFQSLMSPFIVLFTLPLAFTGGLLALWMTGKEISVIAMLGFLILSGVVVNNGIVFVDYTNQLRLEGMERREALVTTGRDRIRPILMTALTTVFGLVTMAFGLGSGGDMMQPLAIVTIGGLLYATLLTLFVVPVLYDIFQRRPLKKVIIEEVHEL